jgi:glycosyltransferase involved in cell wall biosynthesis
MVQTLSPQGEERTIPLDSLGEDGLYDHPPYLAKMVLLQVSRAASKKKRDDPFGPSRKIRGGSVVNRRLPPKVSCLIVTANRKRLLRRSLLSYRKQTYPHKELVIVDDGQEDLTGVMDILPKNEVIYQKIPKRAENMLGYLRNLTLEMASGDVLAQWDDDDWYHPDRLKIQLGQIRGGAEMCCLSSAIFHLDTKPFFDSPFISQFKKGVPGSIMHVRNAAIRYPEIALGEDDAFLARWKKRIHGTLGPEYAYLFIRSYHGENSWDQSHFMKRLYNSPRLFFGYSWNRFIRRDLFRHRLFRLDKDCTRSFRLYIEDSTSAGVF